MRLADDRAVIAERAIHSWRREAHRLAALDSVRALFAEGPGVAAADRARRDLDQTALEEGDLSIGVVDAGGRVRAASAEAEPSSRPTSPLPSGP